MRLVIGGESRRGAKYNWCGCIPPRGKRWWLILCFLIEKNEYENFVNEGDKISAGAC